MDRPKVAAKGDLMHEDLTRSAKVRRALSVASVIGLTVITLSVVAGIVVESRGPGAHQLPQVSLPAPVDPGVIVAEVTSPSALSTLAPIISTTTSVLVVESGPRRSSGAVGGGVTEPTPTIAPNPGTTQPPESATEVHNTLVPLVSAATTILQPEVAATETDPEHGTTTTLPVSSSTATTQHVVVPPTVRENHHDDDD